MKKSIHLSLIAGIAFVPVCFLSCSQQSETKEKSFASANLSPQDHGSSKQANSYDEGQSKHKDAVSKEQKMLIKTGNLSLRSKHIEKSKSHLDQALQSLDGYYDSEQFSKSEYEFRYSLKLRVPSKNFGRMLEYINGGTDEIVSKNIQTEDVTGEYHDIEARLSSKRAYLNRYEQLLTKANTMEEMLQIEDEIRQLIEEIESQEARLSFLDDQVGYSTLDVELYKTISHPDVESEEPGFWENAKHSLASGWTGVTVLFLGLLSIWPLLVILIPGGIYTYRKLKKS